MTKLTLPDPTWRPYASPDGSRKFMVDPTGFEARELMPRGSWTVANPVYVMREYEPVPLDEATWFKYHETAE